MLRLLADDLTGALDSAAPFASEARPLTVRWLGEEDEGPVRPGAAEGWVISTASRDLPEAGAVSRVAALAPSLAGGRPRFKKIDSLLRGNTLAEIIAAHRSGGFSRTIVTPAFPAQGRLVRGGRLLLRGPDGGETFAADLAGALAEAGVERGITVHDAERDEDLAALVETHRDDPGLLWAGSSGLARALAGVVAPRALPRRGPVLFATGSRHAVTRARLAALALRERVPILRDVRADDAAAPGRLVAERLARGLSAVLDASPPGAEPAAAWRMARCFSPLPHAPAPGLLVVAGGDTLLRLLGALGCTALRLEGEVVRGLPLSALADGAWAGTRLASLSGAFDDGGVIARAIAEAEDRAAERG